MYPYRQLDSIRHEIRILQWIPSGNGDDDKVRCKLAHISLDESPRYNALSYTWGAPEPSQAIIVDGVEVSIGSNLFGALEQIRHSNQPLWVDSLCINQADLQERTDQVCLMGDIYKKADVVVMWLGESEGDGDEALVFLENFKDQLLLRGDLIEEMISNQDYDEAWNAVGKLFRRPYWSRVWIIQEVLLANNPVICCGAASCSWNFIKLILCKLDDLFLVALSAAVQEALLSSSADLARTLARLYDQRFEGRKMTLVDCLALGRQRKATDPRDHIYGMLNLVEDPGIVPDYTISADTLYHNVAQRIIEQDKNLDLLSACVTKSIDEVEDLTGAEFFVCFNDSPMHSKTNLDATANEKPGGLSGTILVNESRLPFWVPDWKAWTDGTNFMFLGKTEECQYRASKDTLARTHIDEKDSNILLVEGIVLDEVLAVAPRERTDDEDPTASLVMEKWAIWESVKPDNCPYGELSEQEFAFERTLFLGRNYGSLGNPFVSKMFIEWAAGDEEAHSEVFSDSFIQDYLFGNLRESLCSALARRFAVTKKGYMGLGPLPVREGDIVAILFGAKVPFILRQFENNYILLGECYIHGVMDGEAMGTLDKGIYEIQKFRLQ